MDGPGKYDGEAGRALESAGAIGVCLLVLGGAKGSGFSAQGTLEATRAMPAMLRIIANQIDRDLAGGGGVAGGGVLIIDLDALKKPGCDP
jgi:hypothetical protein